MHNYEQLALWKRSVILASRLQRLASTAARWSDRDLWCQITGAATSIAANVAEGAQRGSQREFARFLAIAMGSAAELHTLLVLARQSEILPAPHSASLTAEANALRRMAAALRLRAIGLGPRSASPNTRGRQKNKPPEP